jgi:hypothetical protein
MFMQKNKNKFWPVPDTNLEGVASLGTRNPAGLGEKDHTLRFPLNIMLQKGNPASCPAS